MNFDNLPLFENLTWPEAEKELSQSKILLFPLGARLKEHGHHLPLNNDWSMAEYFSKLVTKKLLEENFSPGVLLMPTIQFGFYPAFCDYPGSVNIQEETFAEYLYQLFTSLTNHIPKEKKIYCLNTGISTLWPLRTVQERLKNEGVDLRFTNLKTLDENLSATGFCEEQERGTHADEMETSMMLHILPDSVHMEKAQKDIDPEGVKGAFSRVPGVKNRIYSPTGAWGDPTLASPEKGKVIVENYASQVIQEIKSFSL
jgi:creatinine amidohydrolase